MSDDELRMTFTEHLGELRTRILHAAGSLIIAFIICYILSGYIFTIVARPLLPRLEDGVAAAQWVTLNPIEGFVVKLKLAAYAAIVLALPLVLYQAAAFIFPGLKPGERRAVLVVLCSCSALGIVGVSVAYFGIMPLVLPYLMQWAPEQVITQLRMSETISLILKFYLAFAVAFQFPMVVLALVFLDLITPQTLKQYRRMAIVGIAVLSAVLTPPDPISMLLMGAPLVLLYELSIFCAYGVIWLKRRAGSNAAQPPDEE